MNIEKLSKEYGSVLWAGKKCIFGLPISFTRYILTETTLFTRIGFINIREDEIELYRIYDKNISFTLGQRMFGVGSIRLISSDKTMPELLVKNVKHPKEVKEIIHRQVEEMKTKRRMRFGEISGDFTLGDDDSDLDEME